MTIIISLPVEAIIDRLDNGKRWMKGWGDYATSTGETCLHGAIRYCQPIPGDAYLIEQVGARYGFGTRANDDAANWVAVETLVREHADITDDMLADTFGPQWEHIVSLVRRAAILTPDEATQMAAARAAVDAAAWAAAWAAAMAAAMAAARALVAWAAARALVTRDLIGQHGYTQAHYDTLVKPWVAVIGPVHPDDALINV